MRKSLTAVLTALCLTAGAAAVPATALAESLPEEAAQGTEDGKIPVGEEGSVLNIRCFNEEFKSRMIDHYPTYVELDSMTGKIGDVTVRWYMTSTDGNAYQEELDEALQKNEYAAPDARVDLFLAEEGFLGRYVDAEGQTAIPVSELGITEEELAGQFEYTLQAGSDRDGVVRALTWQCTPGVVIYNRAATEALWGTDDPEQVAPHFATWDDFAASAAEAAALGYTITPSAFDTFRAFADNATTYWVTKAGKLKIPAVMQSWAEMSRKMVIQGSTTTTSMWSSDWMASLMPEGNNVCLFGPEWMFRYCLLEDTEGSIASQGGWGVCAGPAGFFWRGTWICAAKGTDNAALAADIMRTMTCDELILDNILRTDGDFVNNRAVMERAAGQAEYASPVLGGQNPLPVLLENANRIDASVSTRYDAECERVFRSVMKSFFEDTGEYDKSVSQFGRRILKEYPELAFDSPGT